MMNDDPMGINIESPPTMGINREGPPTLSLSRAPSDHHFLPISPEQSTHDENWSSDEDVPAETTRSVVFAAQTSASSHDSVLRPPHTLERAHSTPHRSPRPHIMPLRRQHSLSPIPPVPGAPRPRFLDVPRVPFPPLRLEPSSSPSDMDTCSAEMWQSWTSCWNQDLRAHDLEALDRFSDLYDGLRPSLFYKVARFEVPPQGMTGGIVCSVCLDLMRVGDQCARLGCKHCFHDGCVRDWLKKSHFCPNCRGDIAE